MISHPDLSVCVATAAGQERFLDRFLASAAQMDDHLSLEIVVVYRHKTEVSTKNVTRFSNVKLVEVKEETPLVTAMNQAISCATGRYVSLWRHDAVLTPDCLVRLVEFLDGHPDAGLAAPSLRDGPKERRSAARSFPNLCELFGSCGASDRPMPELREEENAAAEWLAGPGLLINRNMMDEIGGLAERFPRYWRLEYGLRAKKYGWHVYCCGNAQVLGSVDGWGDENTGLWSVIQEKIALCLLILIQRFRP